MSLAALVAQEAGMKSPLTGLGASFSKRSSQPTYRRGGKAAHGGGNGHGQGGTGEGTWLSPVNR